MPITQVFPDAETGEKLDVSQLQGGTCGFPTKPLKTMIIKPYSASAVCPKCTCAVIKSSYRRLPVNFWYFDNPSAGDFQHRECSNCGYSWNEACADRVQVPVEPYPACPDCKEEFMGIVHVVDGNNQNQTCGTCGFSRKVVFDERGYTISEAHPTTTDIMDFASFTPYDVLLIS